MPGCVSRSQRFVGIGSIVISGLGWTGAVDAVFVLVSSGQGHTLGCSSLILPPFCLLTLLPCVSYHSRNHTARGENGYDPDVYLQAMRLYLEAAGLHPEALPAM